MAQPLNVLGPHLKGSSVLADQAELDRDADHRSVPRKESPYLLSDEGPLVDGV